MNPNDVAIRKRTQIAKANRTMFLWIAAASALVGCAVVISIFMIQKVVFNERVLAEKQNTVSILEKNNKVVAQLEDSIRILDTNEALMSVKANETDQAIQVILDALPAEANSLAVGASLQNKLLNGINGLTIESLQVDPVVGVEVLGDGISADSGGEEVVNAISFQVTAMGSEQAIKEVLNKLERSIRPIEILSVRIEGSGSSMTIFIQARTYYEPKKTIELQKKEIAP